MITMNHKLWTQIYRDILSEFISTFVLTAMQTGLIATTIISKQTEGNAFGAALGCGLTVMVSVYIGGGVSGAHINPAVTSTFAIMGKTPWPRVPFYIVAQYFGAFMGAAVTYGIYQGAIVQYDGNYSDLAAIWTTFPAKYLSEVNAMIDSTFSSALLMIMVLAISDQKNMKLHPGMSPFFIGLLVTAVGFGFSYNCGNPMNPARDLAPRFWAYMSGHGPAVMNGPNYVWWWIPVVFPHIGTLIGALIYEGLIEMHYPDEKSETLESVEPSSPIKCIPKTYPKTTTSPINGVEKEQISLPLPPPEVELLINSEQATVVDNGFQTMISRL